jgi:hypothetical protein
MASKKEVFIQQLDIINVHLEREKNGVLHVDHFKNDVELLILMMYYLIKDIKTTRPPLTRLLELQKDLEKIDLNIIDYADLKSVLLKAFKNTVDIKERIELGCLNINTDLNENLSKYINLFKSDEISSVGLVNFSSAISASLGIDLSLFEISNGNDYSTEEIKKLNNINSLNSEISKIAENETNENKKIEKMKKLFEKHIDIEWLTKISEY